MSDDVASRSEGLPDFDTPLRSERFGKRYGRSRPWAVRDVTFSLPRGSITALVGPNGSGKSTLLRACLGFEQPTEGQLVVCGRDSQRERADAVNSVGYIPQASALYRELTIWDHFVMAAAARPQFNSEYAAQRVRDARLSIKRSVGELSGGEQAQVGLAIALATESPLLILDEPLAALDPVARRDFLNALVDHVRSHQATAVLSSHIVTDIEQACDRLVVLGGGRLLLDADIDQALQEYVTVDIDLLGGRTPIGRFAGPKGERLALLRATDGGRPASLEEIVIGHVAIARADPLEDAA